MVRRSGAKDAGIRDALARVSAPLIGTDMHDCTEWYLLKI
ncbi:hypothetical protein CHELA1G11_50025 [Hyphomicrobiales bacterium]|nr:hypothetical protein CHELA1G11_50025 [Hyphomicrobiales bacterium]